MDMKYKDWISTNFKLEITLLEVPLNADFIFILEVFP